LKRKFKGMFIGIGTGISSADINTAMTSPFFFYHLASQYGFSSRVVTVWSSKLSLQYRVHRVKGKARFALKQKERLYLSNSSKAYSVCTDNLMTFRKYIISCKRLACQHCSARFPVRLLTNNSTELNGEDATLPQNYTKR
jgi:hypothetical protein